MNNKVEQLITDAFYEAYEVPRKTRGPKIHVLSVDDTINLEFPIVSVGT